MLAVRCRAKMKDIACELTLSTGNRQWSPSALRDSVGMLFGRANAVESVGSLMGSHLLV